MNKEEFLLSCINYAKSKDGICLATEYISTHEKLLWQCAYNHKWEASPANIKSGKWCPTCSKNKKLKLEDCIKYASSKDGYCLSVEYFNSATKLLWKCKYGHEWEANFNNIKSKGSWCPECATNIGEKICRIFFEQWFAKPFDKIKPIWLKNNNSNLLELDGFNLDLMLAFEYQGIQHYKIDGFFIRDEIQFNKRIEDDNLKIKLCNENKVTLIVIPQLNDLTNFEVIKKYLTKILNNYGFYTDQNINIDLKNLYNNKIDKYKKMAIVRGGVCLSDVYIDYYTKLTWCCALGHIWDAVGYSIEKGHWCPDCAGNRKKK